MGLPYARSKIELAAVTLADSLCPAAAISHNTDNARSTCSFASEAKSRFANDVAPGFLPAPARLPPRPVIFDCLNVWTLEASRLYVVSVGIPPVRLSARPVPTLLPRGWPVSLARVSLVKNAANCKLAFFMPPACRSVAIRAAHGCVSPLGVKMLRIV
jgi:hypothetical protein